MEDLKRVTLGYSLKNIPIPTANAYRKALIEKVESVLKRMRWRAFFFLREGKGGESDDLEDARNFGFNSRKCPPQIEELKPFEDDMVRLIEKIEFRKVSDPFQDMLQMDIRRIRNSTDIIVPADKTRNLYQMRTVQYEKLLRGNITKNYKPAPDGLYDDINSEAKRIATRLKLEDRAEVLAKSEAFFTLKDHKENFENTLPCRLINPAKSELGIVSKYILEDIVGELREKISINLWKNSAAVIDWFKNLEEKRNYTFLCFDIVDFYPSISESLLKDALAFARQYVTITDSDMEVIFHARKSLLFDNGRPWIKRKGSLFDVTMGSYDGAEICELVGAFLLKKIKESHDSNEMGLYRDDGLAALKNSPARTADTMRKSIVQTFKKYGLRITIEANLKIVNFLDVTLNLHSGKFYPYRKPNDQPLYINALSNHPPKILQNLPAAISKRISDLSCDQETFSEAAPIYERALAESGFPGKLTFSEHDSTGRKRKRRRKIIWFNPPFSKNVRTNIGRSFLNLVHKHFPKTSKLHKIFNKNTLKVSYSCMPSIASTIRAKRMYRDAEPEKACNCRVKAQCPLKGKCQSACIVYKATVSSATAVKEYIGLTEPPFKQRYANHLTAIRHETHRCSTELSKYVWDLKRKGEDFAIDWSTSDRAHAYDNRTKRCNLCLAEKSRIITADKSKTLNKRSEIVSKCRHMNKFLLANFSPVT